MNIPYAIAVITVAVASICVKRKLGSAKQASTTVVNMVIINPTGFIETENKINAPPTNRIGRHAKPFGLSPVLIIAVTVSDMPIISRIISISMGKNPGPMLARLPRGCFELISSPVDASAI